MHTASNPPSSERDLAIDLVVIRAGTGLSGLGDAWHLLLLLLAPLPLLLSLVLFEVSGEVCGLVGDLGDSGVPHSPSLSSSLSDELESLGVFVFAWWVGVNILRALMMLLLSGRVSEMFLAMLVICYRLDICDERRVEFV